MEKPKESIPKKKPRKKSFRDKVFRFMNYFFVFFVLVTIGVLVYVNAGWGYWIAALASPGILYVMFRYNHKLVDARGGDNKIPGALMD